MELKRISILLIMIFLCCINPGLYASADSSATKSKKEKVYEDINGKKFYTYKKEPHFVRFKKLKNEKAPMYIENTPVSPMLKYLDFKEYVELVDNKMGLILSNIRSYNEKKGYVEGFTKNNFFFNKDYYGIPYQMSEYEIQRRKEVAEKKMKQRAKREMRKRENQKEITFNKAISNSRDDATNILGLSYIEITQYFADNFSEDIEYTENASQSIKFNSKDNSVTIYLTLQNKKVTGFQFINNRSGYSIDTINILLYEAIGESVVYKYQGETFFTIEQNESKKINEDITKNYGTMKKTGLPIIIKTDNSKDNPIIELTIGVFSGIE